MQDDFRCETTESCSFLGTFTKFNRGPARDSYQLGQTKHGAEIVETKELRKVLERGDSITDFDFSSVVSNLGIGHWSFLHNS